MQYMHREAISVGAPLVRFTRGWQPTWLVEKHGNGATFHPRKQRTWTLSVKGYPVVRVFGKAVKDQHWWI